MSHPYSGITALLPTRHGKESAIRAGFAGILDLTIQSVDVDTDSLGTFSGEVERKLSPLQSAIAKTELAQESYGGEFFIASEGSIGHDPRIPFVVSDHEIVIFRDVARNIVITESEISFEIKAARIEITPGQPIDDFLERADFPRHGLIVKGVDHARATPIKGITDRESLDRAIEEIAANSPAVIVEHDFRAHFSPSRMAVIESAARKLALRISQLCPACSTPGYGVVDVLRGVPCSECGELNPEAVHQEKLGCHLCDVTTLGKIICSDLPVEKCIYCNP